jgi:hypothetical protein
MARSSDRFRYIRHAESDGLREKNAREKLRAKRWHGGSEKISHNQNHTRVRESEKKKTRTDNTQTKREDDRKKKDHHDESDERRSVSALSEC